MTAAQCSSPAAKATKNLLSKIFEEMICGTPVDVCVCVLMNLLSKIFEEMICGTPVDVCVCVNESFIQECSKR